VIAFTIITVIVSCDNSNNIQQNVNTLNSQQAITEVINKLFVYTDERDWDKLQFEVFDKEVLFDMVSVGAEKVETKLAKDICNMWKNGFQGLDAIHHQAGNYIIEIENKNAKVKAYSIASHFKKEATQGNVREFIGSYDIGLVQKESGWRINSFKYNLKYMIGNTELK
jgi:hypothetical protein